MCTALLDSTRRTWTREQWDSYNLKDEQFGERFKKAVLKRSRNDILNLLDEGKNYYHFPVMDNMQILFTETVDDFNFFQSVLRLKKFFYQYETLT